MQAAIPFFAIKLRNKLILEAKRFILVLFSVLTDKNTLFFWKNSGFVFQKLCLKHFLRFFQIKKHKNSLQKFANEKMIKYFCPLKMK